MLKTLSTLLRGAAAAAEEDFTDRNAILILDQQIRDVAAGVERSKGALALAIAQEEAERERLEHTRTRIKDLEERAVAALRGGREDLAQEAAEAIASFEADSQASTTAQAAISPEIRRLTAGVSDASRRLADLRRGLRSHWDRRASGSGWVWTTNHAERRKCSRAPEEPSLGTYGASLTSNRKDIPHEPASCSAFTSLGDLHLRLLHRICGHGEPRHPVSPS